MDYSKEVNLDIIGTYEVPERGSLSNRRPSCGFDSKVDRGCGIKMRRSVSTTRTRPSFHPTLPLQKLSETVRQAGDEEDEESGEYEEYVKVREYGVYGVNRCRIVLQDQDITIMRQLHLRFIAKHRALGVERVKEEG